MLKTSHAFKVEKYFKINCILQLSIQGREERNTDIKKGIYSDVPKTISQRTKGLCI